MEFKFRSVDEKLPPATSIFRDPDMRLNLDPAQNPRSVRDEMIERQLEKEMIREEIIAAEIARRRALEAEVRRELMLERENAMRRLVGEGLGFDQDRLGAMWFDHRVQAAPPPTLDLNNKDKLILLAKPDPNLSGVKWKTPPTVSASELPPFGLKKIPKEEWSCALCHVRTTSEKDLIHHVNSKKHQAKEARLRAQKPSSSNAQSSKKPAKFSQPKEINGIISTELRAKQVRKSLDHNKTSDVSNQKMQEQGTSKEEKEEPPMLKNQCGEVLKNKDKVKMVDGVERKEEWSCALCHVSATSEKDMIHHINGKKHQAKEARLGAQKPGSSNAQSLKKAANSSEPKEINGIIRTGLRAKQVWKSLDHNETRDVSNQKMREQGTSKEEKEEPPMLKDQCGEVLKNKDKVKMVDGVERKEEWSCALCHVSATSETGLIDHINGKKHQAKEAILRAQKPGSSNAQSSKKAANSSEPKEINGIIRTGLRAKQVRKSLDHNETHDISNQKMQEQGTSKEEKEEPPMPKDQCGEVLKNKDKVKMVDGVERKEEWSCALCHVSATSEKGLIDHINGKKHQAKEAILRVQKPGSSNAQSSKKAANSSEPKEINGIIRTGLRAEQVRKSLDHNETRDISNQKMLEQGTSKEEKEEPPMLIDQCGEVLKNKDKVKMVDGVERKEDVKKQKKFKFWCEMCKIGADNPKVWSSHISGKKHIARSQELTLNNVPTASFMASSEASKEAKDADAAKEAQENIPTATAMASSEASIEAKDSDAAKEAHKKIPTPTAISSAEASKDAEDADAAKEAQEKFYGIIIKLMRIYNAAVAKEAKNSA